MPRRACWYPTPDLARVIKARDLNGDGIVDIVVGTTYQTQSRLFLGREGRFREVTRRTCRRCRSASATSSPATSDGDGDLDLVLVDWGPGQQHDQRGRAHAPVAQRRHGALHRRHRRADAGAEGPLLVGPRARRRRQRPRPRHPGVVQALPGQPACSATTAPAPSPTIRARCRSTRTTTSSSRWTSTATAFSISSRSTTATSRVDDQVEPPRARLPERRQGPLPRRHPDVVARRRRTSARTTTWWRSSTYDSDGDADFVIGSLSGPDRLLVNDGKGHLTRDGSTCSTARTRPARSGWRWPTSTATAAWTSCRGRASTRRPVEERVYSGRGLAPDTAPPSMTLVGWPSCRRRPPSGARPRPRSQEPEPGHRVEARRRRVDDARPAGARRRCVVRRVPVGCRLAADDLDRGDALSGLRHRRRGAHDVPRARPLEKHLHWHRFESAYDIKSCPFEASRRLGPFLRTIDRLGHAAIRQPHEPKLIL